MELDRPVWAPVGKDPLCHVGGFSLVNKVYDDKGRRRRRRLPVIVYDRLCTCSFLFLKKTLLFVARYYVGKPGCEEVTQRNPRLANIEEKLHRQKFT